MRSQSADPHGASRTAAPQRPSSTAAGSWGDGAGVAAAADGGLGVAPPQGLGAAALLLPATQPLQGLAQPQHAATAAPAAKLPHLVRRLRPCHFAALSAGIAAPTTVGSAAPPAGARPLRHLRARRSPRGARAGRLAPPLARPRRPAPSLPRPSTPPPHRPRRRVATDGARVGGRAASVAAAADPHAAAAVAAGRAAALRACCTAASARAATAAARAAGGGSVAADGALARAAGPEPRVAVATGPLGGDCAVSTDGAGPHAAAAVRADTAAALRRGGGGATTAAAGRDAAAAIGRRRAARCARHRRDGVRRPPAHDDGDGERRPAAGRRPAPAVRAAAGDGAAGRVPRGAAVRRGDAHRLDAAIWLRRAGVDAGRGAHRRGAGGAARQRRRQAGRRRRRGAAPEEAGVPRP